MSGSGGSNGGGGDDGFDLNCDRVSFNTTITSPNPDLVSGLQAQQELDIVLDNDLVVVKIPGKSGVLGSIGYSKILKLIECMNNGYQYVGTVREVQDGHVKIFVRNK